MKTVTLSAHVEGQQIKLDEPYEIPSDARLLVTVLPHEGEGEELAQWAAMAKSARDQWLEESPY